MCQSNRSMFCGSRLVDHEHSKANNFELLLPRTQCFGMPFFLFSNVGISYHDVFCSLVIKVASTLPISILSFQTFIFYLHRGIVLHPAKTETRGKTVQRGLIIKVKGQHQP